MHPVAAMAGGFVATLGVIGFAITGPTLFSSASSAAVAPASDTAHSVNRSLKGDRLPGPTADQRPPTQPIPGPVRTLQEDKRPRMEGCDPLVSPLSGSSLSRVAGRCIAAINAPERVVTVGPLPVS
jgi:hypothetical protein